MRSTNVLPGFVLIMLLSGCASVFSSTDQKMVFKSDPVGATVYLDGLAKGVTPLVLLVRKDEFKEVRISKAGYRDEIVLMQTKFNKIGLINIIFPFGFTTDASTGAMYSYTPESFYVNLIKRIGDKASNSYLERSGRGELKGFILVNYTSLKQQCAVRCDNDYIETLVWLVAKEYQLEYQVAKEYALQAIASTQYPADFLQRLEITLQAAKQTTVASKANL